MISLTKFDTSDFERLISWIDGKELLTTIAGPDFTYPITVEQLLKYINNPKSLSFNVVDTIRNEIVGHAEIVMTGENLYKLDKVLIGDQSLRGKGAGQQLMTELLRYSFQNLNARMVELNVFDWNTPAIRCYEKVGFATNPNKKKIFDVGPDTRWTALNMTISRDTYLSLNPI
jgi:RimJ/RimL family protein N-acetyltransferase